MTSHLSHADHEADDPGAIGRTGESGLIVTESPGPGVDSIVCTLRAPHEPASVGKVRREVVNDLQNRDLPESLIDEAEIVASELLTNAVRHARPLSDGTIRVRWKIRGDVVEVEVTDGGGESLPRPAPSTVWLSSGSRTADRAVDRPRVGRHRGSHRPRRLGHPRSAPAAAARPEPRRAIPGRTKVARMGKASRRRVAPTAAPRGAPDRGRCPSSAGPSRVPGETDWVAMREILPAATATVTFAPGTSPTAHRRGDSRDGVAARLARPAPRRRHRAGGHPVRHATGDASRDVAPAAPGPAAEPGTPVPSTPPSPRDAPPAGRPRPTATPFEVTVHEGFDFWVEGQDLEGDAAESLERANAAVVPTTKMASRPPRTGAGSATAPTSAGCCPDDEDAATDALARLHAAGRRRLGGDTRLLGAFRACGLLVPVWDLDPSLRPATTRRAHRLGRAVCPPSPRRGAGSTAPRAPRNGGPAPVC